MKKIQRGFSALFQNGNSWKHFPIAVFRGGKEPGEGHSSYHEFLFKLQKLKERMYTLSGRILAEERNRFMSEFYQQLQAELRGDR